MGKKGFGLLAICMLGVLFCQTVVALPTEHVESATLDVIAEYIEPGCLVVLEVENTAFTTAHHLGSEQWADWMTRKKCQPGRSWVEARAELTPLWNHILNQSTIQPVDPSVQTTVRRLQRQGVAIMGLSAKDPDMAYTILNHLKKVDMRLYKTAPHQGHFILPTTYPSKLVHGVLFTGVLNHPGEVLVSAFEQFATPPKVIVVSQRLERLYELHDSLANRGIPITTIRLTAADEQIEQFDPQIAQMQLEWFDKILNNESAEVLRPKKGWFWS